MPTHDTLGKSLSLTIRALVKSLSIGFSRAEIDLSADQFIILKILDHFDEVIQQDIAEKLRKDKSLVLRHINSLQERKLVARITDSTDKRRNYIVLTKQGYEVYNRALEVEKDVVGQLLDGLKQTDIETFDKVLNTIQNNVLE